MTSPTSNVPPEILSYILAYTRNAPPCRSNTAVRPSDIHQNTLAACTLVTRQFHDLAVEQLYVHPVLWNVQSFFAGASDSDSLDVGKPQLSRKDLALRYVRTLTFADPFRMPDTRKERLVPAAVDYLGGKVGGLSGSDAGVSMLRQSAELWEKLERQSAYSMMMPKLTSVTAISLAEPAKGAARIWLKPLVSRSPSIESSDSGSHSEDNALLEDTRERLANLSRRSSAHGFAGGGGKNLFEDLRNAGEAAGTWTHATLLLSALFKHKPEISFCSWADSDYPDHRGLFLLAANSVVTMANRPSLFKQHITEGFPTVDFPSFAMIQDTVNVVENGYDDIATCHRGVHALGFVADDSVPDTWVNRFLEFTRQKKLSPGTTIILRGRFDHTAYHSVRDQASALSEDELMKNDWLARQQVPSQLVNFEGRIRGEQEVSVRVTVPVKLEQKSANRCDDCQLQTYDDDDAVGAEETTSHTFVDHPPARSPENTGQVFDFAPPDEGYPSDIELEDELSEGGDNVSSDGEDSSD